MRARLAIAVSGQDVELREVVLRDKPDAFRKASPSATVPCLEAEGDVLDESLDIMIWSLKRNDPNGWLGMPDEGFDLIARADGAFKCDLDRYKYASRFPEDDETAARESTGAFIAELDQMIGAKEWLFGTDATLADMAILPFVRQFAHVDLAWFDAQPWPRLQGWLERFLFSDRFARIMPKYPQWHPGDAPQLFPER